MLGAIAGDMIGSPYESYSIKTTDFDLNISAFTKRKPKLFLNPAGFKAA
jgi:ADP-ribosylglycohydrolase